MALDGKIQVQSDIIPDGDNEFQPVSDAKYIKGASQTFASIDELVAFHPKKMKRGMKVQVVESDAGAALKIVDYILQADPETMYNQQTLAKFVTSENYLDYWTRKDETISNFERVQEYAPDGPNGARPAYPYVDNPGNEANWSLVYDPSKGHKWLRFRDDDVDANDDGIFDNWTVPIPIGTSIAGGDYIENRYVRQNVTATEVSAQGQMVETDLGSNNSGHYQVLTGNIDVDDGSTVTNLTAGKYFKYNAAYTYTFNNGATARQTLPAPKTSLNGSSNNDGAYSVASGLSTVTFQDEIPAGTDQMPHCRRHHC